MTRYTAHYGEWKNGGFVTRINFGHYCYSTYDRKEAFAKAQKAANETGKVVTVMWEKPTGCGLKGGFWEVFPD